MTTCNIILTGTQTESDTSHPMELPRELFLLKPQITPFLPRIVCELRPFAKTRNFVWAGFVDIRTGALRIIAAFGKN